MRANARARGPVGEDEERCAAREVRDGRRRPAVHVVTVELGGRHRNEVTRAQADELQAVVEVELLDRLDAHASEHRMQGAHDGQVRGHARVILSMGEGGASCCAVGPLYRQRAVSPLSHCDGRGGEGGGEGKGRVALQHHRVAHCAHDRT